MIEDLRVITAHGTDPYSNLATEEYLLSAVRPGQCILYLWQNQRTVVIGRNQNAEDECRIHLLESDDGHLARRLSGGGAVYHDLGNLNFTFLVTDRDYDVERQTQVILEAVRSVGIDAEKNGRNDLTVDGKKFSGHAYYRTGGKNYHHGTLMISVDPAPLERYLNVSPEKLRARGVRSVRSRVGNLADWKPDLTVAEMKGALIRAAEAIYGITSVPLPVESLDAARIEALHAKFASREWNYGASRPLEQRRSARFNWGTVRVDFTVKKGVIVDVALWSDGLDADYLRAVPAALRGIPFDERAIFGALAHDPTKRRMAGDITQLIIKGEKPHEL